MHVNVPPSDLTDEIRSPTAARPWTAPGRPSAPTAPPPTKGMGHNYVELDEMKGEGRAGRDREPEEPDSLPPRPAKTAEESGWWMFEIIACGISSIALAAILVTLALMDQRPLRTWPMKITLNSFIAFMSTIAKAALVIPVAEGISQLKWIWFRSKGSLEDIQKFDEASRGSWGSLKLLLYNKQVHLAKLGAFVMIAALCMDPFVQQVITYPTKMVPSPDRNATIPISRVYDNYSPGAIMALRTPTLDMKAAINSGIYNTSPHPSKDFAMKPHCATGNCTWPGTYHSLAVCSKCANTTALMEKTSCFQDMCVYALPNGLSFDTINRGSLYMNSTSDEPAVNFNETQPTLTSVSTMRGMHDMSSQTLYGIIANECVMYYCVNEYTAEVKNGVFNETLVESHTLDHRPAAMENITITIPPSGNRKTETNYTMSGTAAAALNSHFWGFWTGNVTGSTGREQASSDNVRALYDLGDDGRGGGVPKPGGENETIAAVAAAMTKVLRSNLELDPTGAEDAAARAANQVVGVTWYEETYVAVRWPWMILPIGLEVLAFSFLIMTMIQCKRSGVAIWKSSTLPMLQGKVSDLKDSLGTRR
ncbi:hypothetical protein PG993_008271 [Apiospora rasikravindrae]|uniref:Uncharacterized protein n=1 Tax=Apiospora rasikravindrae TaxID=990691 RepID=A0ABR1T1M8_9PEZI